MKKIFAMALVAIMVIGMLAVYSEGSMEEIVSYENTEKITIEESVAEPVTRQEVMDAVAALDEDGVAAFTEAGFDTAKVSLSVISQKDIVVDVAEDEVATFTVDVEGIENAYIAVFFKADAESELTLLAVGRAPLDVEAEESGILVVALVR